MGRGGGTDPEPLLEAPQHEANKRFVGMGAEHLRPRPTIQRGTHQAVERMHPRPGGAAEVQVHQVGGVWIQ